MPTPNECLCESSELFKYHSEKTAAFFSLPENRPIISDRMNYVGSPLVEEFPPRVSPGRHENAVLERSVGEEIRVI